MSPSSTKAVHGKGSDSTPKYYTNTADRANGTAQVNYSINQYVCSRASQDPSQHFAYRTSNEADSERQRTAEMAQRLQAFGLRDLGLED